MIVLKHNDINQILKLLKADNVIGTPTDTTFGLICHYQSIIAIKKIYEIKNRSFDKPLPLLVKDWKQAQKYGNFSNNLIKYLQENFKLGTVTAIVLRNKNYLNNNDYWNKLDTIALRVTKSKFLVKIINKIGPLVATSCNISGNPPINCINDLNNIKLKYFINEQSGTNIPSTIYNSIEQVIVRN